MKNMKFWRTALVATLVLTVMLSVTGGTIAWFTDSVESKNNVITAGNLDVELQYKTDWADDWADVEEDTKIFDETALYEPGYTETVFLRVANAGNLALKYQLGLNITNTQIGTSVLGNPIKLSDHMQVGMYRMDEYNSGANFADILVPLMFDTREQVLSAVQFTELTDEETVVVIDNVPVLAGEQTSQVIVLALNMPTTVGNEANHQTGTDAPKMNINVNLTATQLASENDSFDNQYDADAPVMKVATADELAEALAAGGKIEVTEAIAVTESLDVSGDTTITLADGASLSNSAMTSGRMFEMTSGSSLTINGNDSEETEINLGGYGLVQFAANVTDATVEINNVTISGNVNTGALVRLRAGNKGLKVELNNVTANITNGYIVSTAGVNVQECLELSIKNSDLSADNAGLELYNTKATIEGSTISSGADWGILGSGEINVSDSVINVQTDGVNSSGVTAGVAVSGEGTLTVESSKINVEWDTSGSYPWNVSGALVCNSGGHLVLNGVEINLTGSEEMKAYLDSNYGQQTEHQSSITVNGEVVSSWNMSGE